MQNSGQTSPDLDVKRLAQEILHTRLDPKHNIVGAVCDKLELARITNNWDRMRLQSWLYFFINSDQFMQTAAEFYKESHRLFLLDQGNKIIKTNICRSKTQGLDSIERIYLHATYQMFDQLEASNASELDLSLFAIRQDWITKTLAPWLDSTNSNGWLNRVETYTLLGIYRRRVSQMYDIVLHYPATVPGLNDIIEAKTRLGINYLVDSEARIEILRPLEICIQDAFAGDVDTVDKNRNLVVFLGKCFKCLKLIDDNGCFLETIVPTLTGFLQKSSFLTRNVASLLVDSSSDEFGLLLNPTAISHDTLWVPDPNTDVSISLRYKNSNVIDILLESVDSRSVLYNEIQTLFGRGLLKDPRISACYAERLGVLKEKLGAIHLSGCDVMFNDMATSSTIKNRNPGLQVLDPVILSHLYWPQINRSKSLSVPIQIEEEIKACKHWYEQENEGQILEWTHDFGRVDLVIETGSTTLEFSGLSHLEATIICVFQEPEQRVWSCEELARQTRANDPNLVKSALDMWMARDVLGQDENGLYFCVL